ncbi:MAG: Nif3-like dinuclear metal center hexameric protein [Pseudomonadota bacterium]
MPLTLREMHTYCDDLLDTARFRDYCPNGLQVEGRHQVSKIAAAVTANQSVIDDAAAWGADVLLVHHGYFWRGEDEPIVGMKRRRIAALIRADMSLMAYHLPLDAHPELGNNAQLASRLGIKEAEPLDAEDRSSVGNVASLPASMSVMQLVGRVRSVTGREPTVIGDFDRPLSRIAWCTGAAQGYIDKAVAAGADVYLSGEISEPTFHAAVEQGIVYIAAGHHATERYGVQALAAHVAEQFALDWRFFDCENPV